MSRRTERLIVWLMLAIFMAAMFYGIVASWPLWLVAVLAWFGGEKWVQALELLK